MRAASLVLFAALVGPCVAQEALVRVSSDSPGSTAACLARIGFEAVAEEQEPEREQGVGVVRDGAEVLLVDAEDVLLGSAAQPWQIVVDDPAAALRALRVPVSKTVELVAAPLGATARRVTLPGGTVVVLRTAEDAAAVAVPRCGDLNQIVLEMAGRYPADGTHTYHWPKKGGWKGCTKDLEYAGQTVCEGDSEGRAYCCGLTFEVFLDAYRAWCAQQARPWRIKDLDLRGVRRLQTEWFGSAADPSCLHTALVSNGLGVRVEEWDDARPGDFVQLWRLSGSGHSVVFLGWERKGQRIVGMRYWSTQGSTEGIGEQVEWFDDRGIVRGKDRRLDPERIWICRVGMELRD